MIVLLYDWVEIIFKGLCIKLYWIIEIWLHVGTIRFTHYMVDLFAWTCGCFPAKCWENIRFYEPYSCHSSPCILASGLLCNSSIATMFTLLWMIRALCPVLPYSFHLRHLRNLACTVSSSCNVLRRAMTFCIQLGLWVVFLGFIPPRISRWECLEGCELSW